MFIFNVIVNLDHGAIPSITKNIEETLSLTGIQLGFLGSLVFLGLVLGSLVAGFIYNSRLQFKTILQISYAGNAIGLFLFAFSTIYSV